MMPGKPHSPAFTAADVTASNGTRRNRRSLNRRRCAAIALCTLLGITGIPGIAAIPGIPGIAPITTTTIGSTANSHAYAPTEPSGAATIPEPAVPDSLESSGATSGDSPEALTAEVALQNALKAYGDAQGATDRPTRIAGFRRAERLFAAAAELGNAGADLWVNLGNAALQGERLGPTILAYRRALAADPNHTRAARNLEHARSLLPAWVPRPESAGVLDSLFFWRTALATGERAAIAAVLFLIAGCCGGVFLWQGRAAARGAGILASLLWLGVAGSVLADWGERDEDFGVMTASAAIGRASDSENAAARFPEPLPGGVEVQILETRNNWSRVRLAAGADAWVRASSVEPVRYP